MSIVPSYYRGYAISVSVYNPLISGGGFLKSIDDSLSSYSHVISVDGGYISANITMNISELEIDEWISKGLGRHIETYGSGGETVWEGFVDNITVSLGNITIEKGRLSEICNRCSVMYTPIVGYDEETLEPVNGATTETIIAEDTDSQYKYGIWEKVVQGGTLDSTEDSLVGGLYPAEILRDTYLNSYKEPETSHNPSLGVEGGSDISITLDCKGYIEWVNNYIYNNILTVTPPFTTDVTDKITKVLQEDPNNIISTNHAYISYNGVLVSLPEDKNRIALEVINECVKLGDIDYNRWMFGIYESRIPYFQAVSSQIDYIYYISSGVQRLRDPSNASEILPWNVRPGKLVFLPDTILGGFPVTDLNQDPRIMFLEQVTFTAPDKLDLQGKKVKNLEQLQAQLGLA